MTTRILLPAALLVLTAAAACSKPEAPPTPPTAEVLSEGPEWEAVLTAARPVGGALRQKLSSNLMAAMQEGGPVAAMEFCNVEALPLTQQVVEEQGMQVFRTSLRLRNPDNAPDAWSQMALDWYQERLAAGEPLPGPHIQKLPEGDYRFYQPLQIGEACLRCHGADDQLAPGVADALAELYPDDRATGYAEEEWRGLIGITLPASVVGGA